VTAISISKRIKGLFITNRKGPFIRMSEISKKMSNALKMKRAHGKTQNLRACWKEGLFKAKVANEVDAERGWKGEIQLIINARFTRNETLCMCVLWTHWNFPSKQKLVCLAGITAVHLSSMQATCMSDAISE
jgi:hypothetical protein